MTEQQTKTAGLAIASLVLGITGYMLTGPIGAIAAIICGHMAKSRIKESDGALEGDGMALAGLILGYVNVGLTVLAMIVLIPLFAAIAIPSFVQARDASQRNACINNMRQIDGAKEQVALVKGLTDGDIAPPDHVAQYIKYGLTNMTCVMGGTYTLNAVGEEPECSEHGSMTGAMSPGR